METKESRFLIEKHTHEASNGAVCIDYALHNNKYGEGSGSVPIYDITPEELQELYEIIGMFINGKDNEKAKN